MLGKTLILNDEWKVEVRTDLYDAGTTEDGFPYTAEVYYVIVTDLRGRRFAHDHRFYGCNAGVIDEGSEYDGLPYFQDVREHAKKEVETLMARVIDAGVLNMEHWTEIEPMYGSEQYQDYYGN